MNDQCDHVCIFIKRVKTIFHQTIFGRIGQITPYILHFALAMISTKDYTDISIEIETMLIIIYSSLVCIQYTLLIRPCTPCSSLGLCDVLSGRIVWPSPLAWFVFPPTWPLRKATVLLSEIPEACRHENRFECMFIKKYRYKKNTSTVLAFWRKCV